MWATAIILIVVLFPAIDVLSAFPLNGITLGNNIHAAFFSNNPARMSNRKISIVFRLAAAIPPVIGACIVRDLDVILSYVGLLGFVITFVFPPLLNMISKRRALKRFGSNKTPYTMRILSHDFFNVVVILFGIGSVIACLILNITYTIIDKKKKHH